MGSGKDKLLRRGLSCSHCYSAAGQAAGGILLVRLAAVGLVDGAAAAAAVAVAQAQERRATAVVAAMPSYS